MAYIDVDLSRRSMVYYVAIAFIVLGHGIHFATSHNTVTILRLLFVAGYTLLIFNDVAYRGKIHVSALIHRALVIGLVLYAI